MKKIIEVAMFVLFIYSFVIAQQYNDRTDGITSEVIKSEWQYQSAGEGETLKVEYQEKYGELKTIYCKYVSKSENVIIFGSPWSYTELFKANINSITITKLKSK